MTQIQPIIDFYKHNAVWLTPLILGVLANLYNGLSKYPVQQSLVKWVIDVLSLVSKSDSAGTFKLPFKGSKVPAGKKHMRTGAVSATAVILMPFLLFTLAGCACWTPEHRNDKGCAILHQIIDCTTDVIKDLAPSVVGIITGAISGNASPDWDALYTRLEAMGIKDGGCILAQLENDFITKPAASPDHMMKAKQVSSMLSKFKDHYQLQDVKYCFTPKGSDKKVCR